MDFRTKLAKLVDDSTGAIVVEAALLISLLLLPLFVGVLDFGTAMYQWKRVNDALQARIIYVAATHGQMIPSNSQQLYSSTTFSTSGLISIDNAGKLSSTLMTSSDISTSITYQCGCVIGTGLVLLRSFSSSQPYCPQPPDMSCNNSSYWAPYVTITTQIQHVSFFSKTTGFNPVLKSTATIRIN